VGGRFRGGDVRTARNSATVVETNESARGNSERRATRDIDMHEIRAAAAVAVPRAQRATGRRIANKTEPRAVSVSVLFPRREIKRKTPVRLDHGVYLR